jgi:hypothetical protein
VGFLVFDVFRCHDAVIVDEVLAGVSGWDIQNFVEFVPLWGLCVLRGALFGLTALHRLELLMLVVLSLDFVKDLPVPRQKGVLDMPLFELLFGRLVPEAEAGGHHADHGAALGQGADVAVGLH